MKTQAERSPFAIPHHPSVYNFDSFAATIVIVAHSSGIKYHLTTQADRS